MVAQSYLVMYMLTTFYTVIPPSCIGALIPFMAADLNIDETEYSTMFIFISLGCLVSAVLFKLLTSNKLLPKHHTTMIICALEVAIFSIAMLYSTTKNIQIIVITILCAFGYLQQLVVYVCLSMVPSKEQVSLWMAFSMGAFGLGTLAGSLIIGYFSYKIFFFVAFISVAIIPAYYLLSSPQKHIQKITHLKNTTKKASIKLEILTCAGLFMALGMQTTLQSWIPTYAVQTHIASKQQAPQFLSIFSIILTVCRFVFGYSRGSDNLKLLLSKWGQLFSGAVCTLMGILNFQYESIYFSSILYGITLSMVFPLLLSIPHEFGIHFTAEQISNMLIGITISTGVLSPLTGFLMKIDPNMYHYSLLGYGVILFCLLMAVRNTLKEQSTQEFASTPFEFSFPIEEQI